jgi:hypothetical protein
MAKILLDYSDGHYSTRPLTDEEATSSEALGGDVAHVEDRVLDAWHRHCDEERAWQAHWRAISNEQAMRRREKELMPLEDAEREIRRLRDDLAQAQRMWSFFEGKYAEHHQEQHREKYVEFTCVFPKPGCDVDVLPPKWRESAAEILEQYSTKHAAEGMRAQGCCCGHEHEKLDAEAEARLKGAGFLIEHDTEAT